MGLSASPSYFPSGRSGVSSQAIVGSDNRTVVSNTEAAPYSATCRIASEFVDFSHGRKTTIASGFMIAPNLVLTCCHVVYHTGYDLMPNVITVYPAANASNIAPLGSAKATRILMSADYIKPEDKGGRKTKDDWAIIELDSNIGNNTGWLGLRWSGGTFVQETIYNTGYPDKGGCTLQNNATTNMILATGKIRWNDVNFLQGDWDASGGNSGGPVYKYFSNSGYEAIGILSAGTGDDTFGQIYPNAYSTATRFTRGMYELFVQCKEEGFKGVIDEYA